MRELNNERAGSAEGLQSKKLAEGEVERDRGSAAGI